MPALMPPYLKDPNLTEPQNIQAVREALSKEGVDSWKLVVLLLGGTEVLIGEMMDFLNEAPDTMWEDSLWLKNPKRVSRATLQNRQTGELITEMRFGHLDLMNNGIIEVRPIGIIPLNRCDELTRLSWLKAYLDFFEGERLARAKAAGLHLPMEEGVR